MKQIFKTLLIWAVGLFIHFQFAYAVDQTTSIIPAPRLTTVISETAVALHSGDEVSFPYQDAPAELVAHHLAELLHRNCRLDLSLLPDKKSESTEHRTKIQFLRLKSHKEDNPESYTLDINQHRAQISASSDAGLFYGAVSLWQMLTNNSDGEIGKLKSLHIEDTPRFAWRGLMLDSARHFQSPEFIKKLIEVIALHKMNVLHWHLTDDQAWRLEIKKYPLLTSIGAWRIGSDAFDSNAHYGGFYSQAEVRDIVEFAKEHFVTIVPEIEMPGHATAAIVAYPFLASTALPPTQILPHWGIFPNLFSPKETTLVFLQNVLDEVMRMFPGQFIHVGGDEAIKDQWKASQDVQALMSKLQVKDEEAIQNWFIKRIGTYLSSHGRRMIGWEEIVKSGPAHDVAAMSWHGSDSALADIKLGHDTVIAAWPNLYFDGRMSASQTETAGQSAIVPLKEVFYFEPLPGNLSSEDRAHALGIEGAVWTEYMRDSQQVELALFPRLMALSELAWSSSPKRGWQDFLIRVVADISRLEKLHVEVSDGAFIPTINAEIDEQKNRVIVSESRQTELGQVRYTIDGAEPSATSRALSQKSIFLLGTNLKAATFYSGHRLSRTVEKRLDPFSLRTRNSYELKSCGEGHLLSIEGGAAENGVRTKYLVNVLNPCWIYPGADLDHILKVSASVGNIPYVFSFSKKEIDAIKLHSPLSPNGELEVHVDSCNGKIIARLPLLNSKEIKFDLPPVQITKQKGRHDLCLLITQEKLDPLWAIDEFHLIESSDD